MKIHQIIGANLKPPFLSQHGISVSLIPARAIDIEALIKRRWFAFCKGYEGSRFVCCCTCWRCKSPCPQNGQLFSLCRWHGYPESWGAKLSLQSNFINKLGNLCAMRGWSGQDNFRPLEVVRCARRSHPKSFHIFYHILSYSDFWQQQIVLFQNLTWCLFL